MEKFEQNPVSKVVWRWQESAENESGAGCAGRRIRTLLQCAVMVAIGLALWFKFGRTTMAKVVFGLAGIVLVSGLFVPPAFLAIERFGRMLGRGAAVGLTWLLLVPFYYLTFVPGNILLRLRGKDPLCRRFPTHDSSYWVARPPVENLDHYRKQH